MTNEKRNKIKWLGGIHTINGVIPRQIDLSLIKDRKEVKKANHRKVAGKNELITYIELNISKAVDKELITSYSAFDKQLKKSLSEMGIKKNEFIIRRVDFALNNGEPDNFQQLAKLHRFMVACIATRYRVANAYETIDLISRDVMSLSAKRSSFQVENYDKAKQSNGYSDFANRLELRSLRLMPKADIKEIFAEKWINDRLGKSLTDANIKKTLMKINNELLKKWTADQAKTKKNRRYTGVQSFLLAWQDVIFSTMQMRELLRQMGVRNAENARKNFKKNHKIEYICKEDIKKSMKEMKKAINSYFD